MIALNQVSKSYGKVLAVERISFEVPPHSALAILGPSGSGKTTLLRLIAGLEMPDQGEISLWGDVASRPGWVQPPHQRGIGFVFQTPALWPHMTAAQNVLFGMNGTPKPLAHRRLDELVAQLRLEGLTGRYPAQLSGGEARRVALARALAPRPRCLLMDEPLTNLDAELKGEILPAIQALICEDGPCLVYVTHDAGEAAFISERVLTLAYAPRGAAR
jgi:iron(III) transport system ATP-binding protein